MICLQKIKYRNLRAKNKPMKYSVLTMLIGLALFGTACKSDKKADDTNTAESEEVAFREASLTELTGEFADPNYPDKGFWKKFDVEVQADSTVKVKFSSSKNENGQVGCNFSGTGVYTNGYIRVPINPGFFDPTYLTIRYLLTGDIFVGAEGGPNENPSDALRLFCMTSDPITIGGLYEKLQTKGGKKSNQ